MRKLNYKEIGKRIKTQRLALGMTIESLAESTEITPKFCANIEHGKKGMSLTTLHAMSIALGLSTDYILYGNQGNLNMDYVNLLIKQCPSEKFRYLENIILQFINSTK